MMAPDQIALIRSLYAGGMSGPKVAQQLGITDDKVYYHLGRQTPRRQPRLAGPRKVDELECACQEAARHFGVRVWVLRAGVARAAWRAVAFP